MGVGLNSMKTKYDVTSGTLQAKWLKWIRNRKYGRIRQHGVRGQRVGKISERSVRKDSKQSDVGHKKLFQTMQ